ncbi:hypothetical protein BG015_008170 [Linnemannia schmuckeri]|uniref:Uncharacterized protein n=1 Tax=Linnemannia schmuckeri TaxID=64567 RepID=A0A9P5S0T9_9FUNG|nr:hypothetical protein BG015_008170 [Linnemannia schmuckeri]
MQLQSPTYTDSTKGPIQTTTAGSRDLQHRGSALALSNSNNHNHSSGSSSSNNNNDAESKRRKMTQACDYCRQKRTKQCQATLPPMRLSRHPLRLHPLQKMRSHSPQGARPRGPPGCQVAIDHTSGRQIVKPKPARNIGLLQLTHYGNLRPRFDTLRTFYSLHHSYFSNHNQSDNLMRRLTEEGHIPSLEAQSLFEHCFQDVDNFDPKEFLKGYAERKINSSLLNAICIVAARFSDHPDIVQLPPYLSGEPYAEKMREKVMNLIDEATISKPLHALFILSFYEHNAWSGPKDWRLKQHRQVYHRFWTLNYTTSSSPTIDRPDGLKASGIGGGDHWRGGGRQWHSEDHIDSAGDNTQRSIFSQDFGQAAGGMTTSRLRTGQHINGNTLESDKCPSDSSSEFAVLEGRLSTWIKTIEEEVPLTPKELVESEDNVAYMILTYYMTVIKLHRPIIALENVIDASYVDQSRVWCAEAATKITKIVEQFNEIDIKYRKHLFVFRYSPEPLCKSSVPLDYAPYNQHISSDDALAANVKLCLNVRLHFLKASSPHWTVSARLYFILQDLYSGQVRVDTQGDLSTVTSTDATPQGRSGSESRSNRASSSETGHSSMSVSLEDVRIDHTLDHQDVSEADTALTRQQSLTPPGFTTSNMVSITISSDSRSDGAAVQGSSEIGFDHGEADLGGSTTLAAGSTSTKRPSKKAKKMPFLSRPILPRPLMPGSSAP